MTGQVTSLLLLVHSGKCSSCDSAQQYIWLDMHISRQKLQQCVMYESKDGWSPCFCMFEKGAVIHELLCVSCTRWWLAPSPLLSGSLRKRPTYRGPSLNLSPWWSSRLYDPSFPIIRFRACRSRGRGDRGIGTSWNLSGPLSCPLPVALLSFVQEWWSG